MLPEEIAQALRQYLMKKGRIAHESQPLIGVIYLRVSSPTQEKSYSLLDQRRAALQYAACLDVTVPEEHVINDGYQKSYVLDRPGLNMVRDLIRHGCIHVVIVGKYDRLSRKQFQQMILVDEADEFGVRILSANPRQQFDFSSATGKFMLSTIGSFSESERDLIIERTQGGRRSRAESGKLIPGNVPLYGYLWGDPHAPRGKTHYIVDPETAPVVRRIFELVASGESTNSIPRLLNAEGIPTPTQVLAQRAQFPGGYPVATQWTRAMIFRIVSHPTYWGRGAAYRWRVRHKERQDHGEVVKYRISRMLQQDDEQVIYMTHDILPPLVDPALAATCAAQLAHNRAETARNERHSDKAILRGGYALCGYCGSNMNVAVTRKNILVYRCPKAKNSGACSGRHFTAGVVSLDAASWFFAMDILRNPQHIRETVKRLKNEVCSVSARIQADLKAIEGKLKALNEEANNLVAGLAQSKVESARNAIAVRLDMVYSEIDGLGNERKPLEQSAQSQVDYEAQIENLERWAKLKTRDFGSATYEQKRQVLYGLGLKVTIWRSDHEPRFTITSTPRGLTHRLFMMTDKELTELRRVLVSEHEQ